MTKRILIIDDEPAANALAAEYLRLSGFEVAQCYDGENALQRLREDPAFDLIILDKRLPGIGGVEACQAIKDDPRTRGIPVVILSASIHPARIEEGSGAAAFLPKPFSPRDLLSLVQKLLP